MGSKENRVVRYRPINLTAAYCEKAAGEDSRAPKSMPGAFVLLLAFAPPSPDPRVFPAPEKEGDALAGLLAALAAAERMAVRRAVGLAPRMISTTVLPFKMRKVGILRAKISSASRGESMGRAYAEMP